MLDGDDGLTRNSSRDTVRTTPEERRRDALMCCFSSVLMCPTTMPLFRCDYGVLFMPPHEIVGKKSPPVPPPRTPSPPYLPPPYPPQHPPVPPPYPPRTSPPYPPPRFPPCNRSSPRFARRGGQPPHLRLDYKTPAVAIDGVLCAPPSVCTAFCVYRLARGPLNNKTPAVATNRLLCAPPFVCTAFYVHRLARGPLNNKTPAVVTDRLLCAPPCVCTALCVYRLLCAPPCPWPLK